VLDDLDIIGEDGSENNSMKIENNCVGHEEYAITDSNTDDVEPISSSGEHFIDRYDVYHC
jgi:hypothetical protein